MKVDRDILNNLCLNITDGEHGTIQNDNDGRYFLLSNKNIINGQIIISDADRRINKESFSKINKRTKLENGDLVISTVGVLGKLAIIKAENLNYDFQRSVGIVKCDEKKINTKYLYYYLNTQFFQNRLNHLSKGAVQKCLFISDLKNLEIDFPDLPTQQKIASVLSALDDKIELNNRINAELEAMAKTLYDYWFVQFDFPNAEGKPYKASDGKMVYNETLKREIPEGWEVKSLYEIANIIMGQSPKGESYNEKKEGTIFFQGSTDFGWRFPKNRVYTSTPTRFAKENDILLSVRAPIGTMNLAMENCCIGRGLSALNSKDGYSSFLIYQMHYFKKKFDFLNSVGTTFGSLTKDELYNLVLVYPSKKILEKFENLVSEFDKKIKINSKQNQELSALRDWLLPMLMNGQVKVG
ncbi:restriction endonuclease subunit S [Epilithonimonas hominis]|uniref:Restriction endonuclease subunit S n=1 Tax=Epilithonimonas hominis TaxID=420404 RepID=A0A3N0XC47_9FLAO|nr:restriction endonuclease subunit S [Epilithonimonas hominis]ROI14705.1 restriction endonuclease subunit S [Epilithonimonas hominis]